MKEKVLEIINNIRAAKDMAPVAELHIEDNLRNDLGLTSSKSTVSLYEQLAYTCCNYIANPKISIHKQPQLLTAKVRFLFINKEM